MWAFKEGLKVALSDQSELDYSWEICFEPEKYYFWCFAVNFYSKNA
jgi:hypothetical protein